MNRKEFLQVTGITALAGAIPIALRGEEEMPEIAGIIGAREKKNPNQVGYIALAECEIAGSRLLPVRPYGEVIRHGDLVRFVTSLQPQQGKTNARVYKLQGAPLQNLEALSLPADPDMIKYRVRIGEPTAPYYLFWKEPDANLYVYTAPGALIKRACALLRQREVNNIMQAADHIRFAALLNAAHNTNTQITSALQSAEDAFQRALRQPDCWELCKDACDKYFAAAAAERA